jgi:hypothetical protein
MKRRGLRPRHSRRLFRGSAGPCAGGAICGGDRNSTAAVRVGRKSRTIYREAEQRGHFRWGKTAVLDEGGQNCPRGSALFAVLAPPAENRHAGIPAPGAETATASMERTSRRQTPQRRSASQKHWRRRRAGRMAKSCSAVLQKRSASAAPRGTCSVRGVRGERFRVVVSCRKWNEVELRARGVEAPGLTPLGVEVDVRGDRGTACGYRDPEPLGSEVGRR